MLSYKSINIINILTKFVFLFSMSQGMDAIIFISMEIMWTTFHCENWFIQLISLAFCLINFVANIIHSVSLNLQVFALYCSQQKKLFSFCSLLGFNTLVRVFIQPRSRFSKNLWRNLSKIHPKLHSCFLYSFNHFLFRLSIYVPQKIQIKEQRSK